MARHQSEPYELWDMFEEEDKDQSGITNSLSV